MQALNTPDVPLTEVGKIIEQDVGMAAKVLQLVSSAFFGLSKETTTVRTAVNYLGIDILKQLVLSVEIFRTFQPAHQVEGFSIHQFQEHSRQVASIAARLPVPKSAASGCVVAALLHDTGKLIMANKLPEQYELAYRTSIQENRPQYAVEKDLFKTSHAEIGGYLLGLWGLPASITAAVCWHHSDELAASAAPKLDMTTAIQIADTLAHDHLRGPHVTEPPHDPLNEAHLASIGMGDEIPGWRAMAEEVLEEASSVPVAG
jgi:HD-like signal output (HDOD) protein